MSGRFALGWSRRRPDTDVSTRHNDLAEALHAPPIPSSRRKEIAWAEGLRGIAAIGVLSSHLCLCFAKFLFSPCCDPNTETSPHPAPHLFQLPVFRLVVAGQSYVALFLVLTGFTASHKAIGHARTGAPEKAYASVAASSFRRLPRLFLPATIATLLSWAMCSLGGYEVARKSDAWWLIEWTPTMSIGPWYQVFVDGFWGIWTTWMPHGVDPYDQPQWALQFFVEGGFMLFLAVLGTARLSTWWRVIILGAWAWWSAHLSVEIRDPYVGFCVLFGMTISELNLSSWPSKKMRPLAANLLGLSVVLAGLVAMSYPTEFPEYARWSHALRDLGEYFLPKNDSKDKAWASVGALITVFGVVLSPLAQRALSFSVMLWLGKISFPLYLLHGTFIRSLFAWILFAGAELGPSKYGDEGEQRYPLPSAAWTTFAVVCLLAPLLLACHFWVKYLEPAFDRFITWMERKMLFHRPEEVGSDDDEGVLGWKRRGRGCVGRIASVLRAVARLVRCGRRSPGVSLRERSFLLHDEEELSEYMRVSLSGSATDDSLAEQREHEKGEDMPETSDLRSSPVAPAEEVGGARINDVLALPSSSGTLAFR